MHEDFEEIFRLRLATNGRSLLGPQDDMKIWTVDAFTTKPYAGNPAGVTIVKDFPADSACQSIAAEMNLSETAFVKPLSDNHFHIRWFTPKNEVKLCGHATLASAHILYQEKLANTNEINFISLSGPLRVYKNNEALTLDFPLQKTGPTLDKNKLQEILQIEIADAEQALDDVIVELPNPTILRNFQPNFEKINMIDCRGLILTTKGEHPYDFVSRFFAPQVGVPEDPVTGSAHCKLADYWQKRLHKTKFLAYQASRRGGELKISIISNRVHLTGNAVTVMQGEWLIN